VATMRPEKGRPSWAVGWRKGDSQISLENHPDGGYLLWVGSPDGGEAAIRIEGPALAEFLRRAAFGVSVDLDGKGPKR